MGYHPETLAFSFPPYARPKAGALARLLYRLKPWIGFDIWHIDPERKGTGQRPDDSCGWFDRRPGEYADAVAEILQDQGEVQALRNAFNRAVHQPAGYSTNGWVRMTPADTLAACLMVAMRLDSLRHWRLSQERRIPIRSRYAATMRLATNLALNEADNLQTNNDPETFVRSIVAALTRRFRPWWRHPRWHVHHWQINFDLWRNLRRATVERCGTCRKAIGFNICPIKTSAETYHHSDCFQEAERAALATSYPAEA